MFRSRDLDTAVSVEDSTENPVWREQEGKIKIPSPDDPFEEFSLRGKRRN